MGIWGPTKKGGGLDMRFKSNSGGYLGKSLRLGADLYDLSKNYDSGSETPDRNPFKIWWARKMITRSLDKKINEELLDSFENNREFIEQYKKMVELSKTDKAKYLGDIDETIKSSFGFLKREGFGNLFLGNKKFETATEESLINSKRTTFIGYYVRTKSFKTFLSIVKKEVDRLNEVGDTELSKLVQKKYTKAKRKAFFISGNFFLLVIALLLILIYFISI